MGFLASAEEYKVSKYKEGTKEIGISTVKNSANDFTAMNGFAPGYESGTALGESIVVDNMGGSPSFMVGIGGLNQNISPEVKAGERRIYSTDPAGESVMSDMVLKNDGTIIFKIGTTEIEFSVTGISVSLAGISYDFITHIHPTPAGPSGPQNPEI